MHAISLPCLPVSYPLSRLHGNVRHRAIVGTPIHTHSLARTEDNNLRTNTPEWRAKNPNHPNPLRDPEGKVNSRFKKEIIAYACLCTCIHVYMNIYLFYVYVQLALQFQGLEYLDIPKCQYVHMCFIQYANISMYLCVYKYNPSHLECRCCQSPGHKSITETWQMRSMTLNLELAKKGGKK